MVTLEMLADDIKEVDEQCGRDLLVKKRKRGKNKGVDGSEERGHSVDDESLKMAKKDKKKTKIETNKDGSLDGEKKTTKKKKNNKKQLEENGGDDVSQRSLTQGEPSGKKQKKLKKTSDKSVQSKAAGCFKTEEEEEAQATKKKKSKKVMVENQSEVINIDESEDDKDVVEMITTTTKKNKAGSKTSVTKTVAGQEESQGVHHKAKKRKAHLETAEEIEIVEIVTKKKKGKKEETKPTKTKKAKSSAVVDEESTKPKKKTRRGKRKREISSKVEGDQEVSMVDDKEQKRKKKNAKIDIQAPVRDMAQNTEKFVFVACDAKGKGKKQMKGALEKIKIKAKTEEVEVHVDKKKRKKKIKLEEDAPEIEPTPEVTPHTDVVFLSEKTGNRDEVTINQERRLALQMDIDKESRPQTPATPGFGQWGTARFESTEKQQKFLRLMGGFKKETQTSGPSAARPNMALARDQQQNLHQALLGEFERAQSRRLDFSGRGAGLGFSAPPSKKFSIDANATRSVRFDD
ncbi:Lysine-rich nucleolar protein 1 [Merluccius polli]|uniref:Lysine-rich nucleolar protein 1 n=1 Tax=Merluccius polli TaxID=89951 RepID=A0AA47N449_MERPO|nr:Lysine-rich nucleolar protein 1 [Merluccius polli]